MICKEMGAKRLLFSRSAIFLRHYVSSSHMIRGKALCYKKHLIVDLLHSQLLQQKSQDFLILSARNYRANAPIFYSTSDDGAAEVLVESKKQNTYEEILKLCREIKPEDPSASHKSKELLSNMRPTRFREEKKHTEFQSFIRSFPKGTDLNLLLKALAEKSGSMSLDIVLYNHLIQIFSLSGECRRAQEVFDLLQVKGLTPNGRTYSSLMNAYANKGELAKTTEIFEHLKKDTKNLTEFSYGILIKTYLRLNRIQDAIDVIKSMSKKLPPRIIDYTAVIQACIKIRDFDRAWLVYDMMRKDKCLPNLKTYTLLISIAQKKDLKKAFDLFEELLNSGGTPDYKLITSLLSALSSVPSYYPTSLELLNTLIRQHGFEPDAVVFNILIRGASLSRNLPDARRFFYQKQQAEPHAETSLSSYSAMFEAYSLAFASDGTERFIDSISPEDTSGFEFLQTPSPTRISDCVNEAIRLLPSLKSNTSPYESTLENSRPWVSFLSILTNYNYFDDAMKWFEIISTNFNRTLHPQFYKCMLEMCYKLQKRNAFFSILERAKSLLEPIHPNSSLSAREKIDYRNTNLLASEPLEGLYRFIIVGLAKFDCLGEALDYFEILTKNLAINWKLNEKHYEPFLNVIQLSPDPAFKLRLDQLI